MKEAYIPFAEEEKHLELTKKSGDFLKEAFCVNGTVNFVKYTKPEPGFNCTGMLYKIEDQRRGEFYVGIFNPVKTN